MSKLNRPNYYTTGLLLLSLILCPVLEAVELPEQAIKAAVQTWLRKVSADARPNALVEKMEPYEVNGRRSAYIAHLKNGGFCLAGANEVVLPVYFYSPNGVYDRDNTGLQIILDEIAYRTQYLTTPTKLNRSQDIQRKLNERAIYWRELISGSTSSAIQAYASITEPDKMTLKLTSTWGQGSPYNDQCPNLTDGQDERVAAGCVAIAQAQIMYYWEWPTTGNGTSDSVTYTRRWTNNQWIEEPLVTDPNIPQNWFGGNRLQWTSANGGRLRANGYWDLYVLGESSKLSQDTAYKTALNNLWNNMTSIDTVMQVNFGATNYSWDIMKDTHSDPPDAGAAETAKLVYHAGLANNMGYGLGLSLTGSNAEVLKDHFRYDPDVKHEDWNTSTSMDKVTEEIQWLRPVEFNACGQVGCHDWVIYGYNKETDPNRQYKMNFGWYGGSDGWYTYDSIDVWTNPSGPEFDNSQSHTTRIAPQDVVKFVGNAVTGDGSPSTPYKDIEEALTYASDGTTLIFRAGSTNTFSANSLVIDKPLILKGYNVTIKK